MQRQAEETLKASRAYKGKQDSKVEMTSTFF